MPTPIKPPETLVPTDDIMLWSPREWCQHLVKGQRARGERRNMERVRIAQTHVVTDEEPDAEEQAELLAQLKPEGQAAAAAKTPQAGKGLKGAGKAIAMGGAVEPFTGE